MIYHHLNLYFLLEKELIQIHLKWAESLLKVPVIDHWWQTETSWAISANCAGLRAFKNKIRINM